MLARFASVVLAASLVAACGGGLRGDGPPRSGSAHIPGDALPRREAPSKYGNGPVYEVLGKRYTVMPTSRGYQERGVASWYGRKFHGRLTSSREVYDMHLMTAAHRTLPLPSYVRVRNLRNNRSIVVRVNDRGPFVHNRIIDLSYSAALKLDMIRDGTSLVEVTAINFDEPAGDRPTRIVSLPSSSQGPAPGTAPAPPQENPTASQSAAPGNQIFVQVGAFGDRQNAERRLGLLARSGIDNAFVYEDLSSNPALLRVRIGPVADVPQYDLLVDELEAIGITDPYLVVDQSRFD